ncbi:MAG: M50 family metallopeptidase [Patescibacteria group bacterium]|nr:M50 family metallopeptidase [Patescibacteria group bacterium]MBU1953290.1 M50 family metallopeptidase [Patescibacteria group bacterium]
MTFLTFILIILVLSSLILIHEFGHFIAARKNGVRVEEFGIGYPPRIWGRKIGETLYSINVLPLGGFVRIAGEEVESDKEEKEYVKDPGSFISKPPRIQALILTAGIIMNTLVAVFLFYIFFFVNGFKSFYIPMIFDHEFRFGTEHSYNTVIFDMTDDSAAKEAGMQIGEAIIRIDGQEIKNIQDEREALMGKSGLSVKIEALDMRDRSYTKIESYTVTPKPNLKPESASEGDSIIGVYTGEAKSISYDSTLEKIFSGPLHAYNLLSYSLISFGKIIGISVQDKSVGPVSETMVGPVGVFNIMVSVFKAGGSKLALSVIDTLAIISLGFAFSNILPIPALDGGRIAFKVYEMITRKRVKPSFEANVHKVGMYILLGLMLLITLKDLSL